MSLSPAAYFGNIDANNPIGSDSRTISDDQHRNILKSLKDQGPNWTSAIISTHSDLNLLSGWFAAGKVPAPRVANITVEWFYNTSVPVGYTPIFPDSNIRNLCIATSGFGTVSGTIDPSSSTLDVTVTNVSVDLPANTGGHGLTQDENGQHRHLERGRGEGGGTVGNSVAIINTTNPDVEAENFTNYSGQGTPHTHPLGGTASQTAGSGTGSTAAFNPRRATGILGKLNA